MKTLIRRWATKICQIVRVSHWNSFPILRVETLLYWYIFTGPLDDEEAAWSLSLSKRKSFRASRSRPNEGKHWWLTESRWCPSGQFIMDGAMNTDALSSWTRSIPKTPYKKIVMRLSNLLSLRGILDVELISLKIFLPSWRSWRSWAGVLGISRLVDAAEILEIERLNNLVDWLLSTGVK